jgi:hypothetical protein
VVYLGLVELAKWLFYQGKLGSWSEGPKTSEKLAIIGPGTPQV